VFQQGFGLFGFVQHQRDPRQAIISGRLRVLARGLISGFLK
jgi:hypothetical protein